MSKALRLNHSSSAIVVSSKDGLDEVSISDITYACKLKDGDIYSFVIDPTKVGLTLYAKNDIKGGDPYINATITKDIFKEKQKGAKRDIVLLNTAVALVVDGKVETIKDGLEVAKTHIANGQATQKLEQIIDVSNSF
jgi:anthranilate phosphoribosyltransferase